MSLALDKNNAKTYLMRAKARAKLGKLELAIQGRKFVLHTTVDSEYFVLKIFHVGKFRCIIFCGTDNPCHMCFHRQ